jgi:hypothetical protein
VTGGHLIPGVECVIWGSMGDAESSRLIWVDDNTDCGGDLAGTATQTEEKIVNGVAWTCSREANASAEYTDIVGALGFDQQDLRQGIQDRLGPEPQCGDDGFQAAMGKGDGALGASDPPPPFDGGGRADLIYVQNGCFDNRRIVVIPFTNDPATSGGDKQIDGFAVVFITGCYLSDEPMHEGGESVTETDECENWDPATPEDRVLTNDCIASATYVPSDFCKYEVRGVPVRVFLAEAGIGRLGSMTDTDGNDFPLTIQTME